MTDYKAIKQQLTAILARAQYLMRQRDETATYDHDTRRRAVQQLSEIESRLQDIIELKEPGSEAKQEREEDSWEARAERIRNAAIANRPSAEEIERMKAAERKLQEEARRFERVEPEPEEPEPDDEPQEPEPPPKPRESKTLEKRTDTRWKRTPKDAA